MKFWLFWCVFEMLGVFVSVSQICPPGIEWQQSFGGSGWDLGWGLLQVQDGGYIMAANSESPPSGNKTTPNFGNYDLWVVRFNSRGNILWDRSFGGSGIEYSAFIIPDGNGGFFLAGNSNSGQDGNKTTPNNGVYGIWLLRLDRDGNKLWERSYGSRGEGFQSFAAASDGGLIVDGGYASSAAEPGPEGNANIWILRLDSDGNELWSRDFGGTGNDSAIDIHQTRDGGFIFDAESSSPPSGSKTSPHFGDRDYWIVRLDANGNKLWDRSFGGTNWDSPGNIQETPTGGFIVSGGSSSPPGGNKTSRLIGSVDTWLLRLDSQGNKLFEQTYGGAGSSHTGGILQRNDGGVLLFGSSGFYGGDRSGPYFGNYDYWMLRLDANGKKLWDMSFGGSSADEGINLQPTLDGGFLFSGYSFSGVEGNKTTPSYGDCDFWVIKLGPEQVCDSDGDGVPDDVDLCPNTPFGVTVDAHGCSIEQLAPCEGPWKNHGQYVQALNLVTEQFLKAGLISKEQLRSIRTHAATSNCGKDQIKSHKHLR